jgi:hypothetical protein
MRGREGREKKFGQSILIRRIGRSWRRMVVPALFEVFG